MSKILYVSEEAHQKLKFLATKLGISMQDATEESVRNWISQKENEERQQEVLLTRIENKLSAEEKKVLEAILARKKATH
jgi:hypothetical protein